MRCPHLLNAPRHHLIGACAHVVHVGWRAGPPMHLEDEGMHALGVSQVRGVGGGMIAMGMFQALRGVCRHLLNAPVAVPGHHDLCGQCI